MPLQNFVDKVGPVISSAWLNAVDVLKTTIFADAATKAAARVALTSDAAFELANGGTGKRTLQEVQNLIGMPGKSATIASGSTMDLGAAASHFILTTGTATINSFGSSASTDTPFYILKTLLNNPVIHNSANIICPGGKDITLFQDQQAFLYYQGSGVWRVLYVYNGDYNFNKYPWTDMASGTTVSLGGSPGDARYINITGTSGISSFGSAGNTLDPLYTLYFESGCTITGGGSLSLPGGASSLVMNAGDSCTVIAVGSSSWQVRSVVRNAATYETSGTFTPSWVGFSTFPSSPVSYTKVGDLVTLTFSNAIATSNATQLYFTGLPAALRQTTAVTRYIPILGLEDNSVILTTPSIMAVNNTDTVHFYKNADLGTTTWTGGNTKGIFTNAVVSYSIK